MEKKYNMGWKEVYEKNINRKTEELEKITSDFLLKTNYKNVLKYHKKTIYILGIIFSIIIIITFKFLINIMLPIFILLSILIFCSLFFLNFSIKGFNNNIIIETNGEEVVIPYNKVKQIYLEKNTDRIFIKKRQFYTLIILYENNRNNICDLHLPTFLLDVEEFQNWLKYLKVKFTDINYQEKCIKYKRKRFRNKFILFLILMIIAIIITLIF